MIRRPIILVAFAVAVLGPGLTGCSSSSSVSVAPTTATTAAAGGTTTGGTTAASEGDISVTTFPEQSRDHVKTSVAYPQGPPIGGEHSAIWQNCGFYSTPVADENAVHSMEHGAVWITYSPDLPVDQQAELKAMAAGHTHVLISPYPGLTSPVVASAWRTQKPFAAFDAAGIQAFIKAYEEGPQTPEPGAPCDGALGSPES